MNRKIRSFLIVSFLLSPVISLPASAQINYNNVGQNRNVINSRLTNQNNYNIHKRIVRIPASFFAGMQKYNQRLAYLHFKEMKLRKEGKVNAANAIQPKIMATQRELQSFQMSQR